MRSFQTNIAGSNRLFWAVHSSLLLLLVWGCQKVEPELAKTLDGTRIQMAVAASLSDAAASHRRH